MPRRIRAASSLRVRYVGALVASQVVFGTLLSMVVGVYSVQALMDERQDGLSHLSRTIAASLLPLVADQDPVRIQAQLDSILHSSGSDEIVCIRILDGSGREIAESSPECTCDSVRATGGLLSIFTDPKVVKQGVSVDGFEVASAEIQFKPVGVGPALLRPMTISALVVAAAVVVSGLWGTYILMRSVVEPVTDLRDAAMRIAQGDREVRLKSGGADEIGQLSDALDAMTRQLEDREARLQRTARAKSEFVATASHELRSPLAVLQLYAEMLREGHYGPLTGESAEAVESMLRATLRLSSIVATLMDVALLERGTLPMEFEDGVRIDELVRHSAEDAAALAAKSGVSVRLDPQRARTAVRADAIRVRQVGDNLLSNAVKYSEPGGEVLVSVTEAEDGVRIRIADRGPGIPADRSSDVFEPFVRLEAEDDAAPGGVGLGLAVSAKIVRAHGGEVTVEENQGGGSVFVVALPFEGPPTSPVAEAS